MTSLRPGIYLRQSQPQEDQHGAAAEEGHRILDNGPEEKGQTSVSPGAPDEEIGRQWEVDHAHTQVNSSAVCQDQVVTETWDDGDRDDNDNDHNGGDEVEDFDGNDDGDDGKEFIDNDYYDEYNDDDVNDNDGFDDEDIHGDDDDGNDGDDEDYISFCLSTSLLFISAFLSDSVSMSLQISLFLALLSVALVSL